jgi:DNA-binding Lrp family transcriptional regulator
LEERQPKVIYKVPPELNQSLKKGGWGMEAIVYIRADPGKALALLEEVKKVEGVKAAFAVTGRFDIVARIEAPDLKTLGEIVIGKIQGIAGIRSTETAPIVA